MLTAFASSALGNAAVYDHEAYGLFRQVVRRFDTWRSDKAEVGIAVSVESLGQVLGRFTPRCPSGGVDDIGAGLIQGPLKASGGHGFAPVNDTEQLTQ